MTPDAAILANRLTLTSCQLRHTTALLGRACDVIQWQQVALQAAGISPALPPVWYPTSTESV